MRLSRWVLTIGAGIGLSAGAASAAPVPGDLFGAWTDEPGCAAAGHRMVFSADAITMVEGDGHKVAVHVDTAGDPASRLEITVVAPPNDEGPKVGSVIVVRLEKGELHLVAQGETGAVQDVSGVPPMHHCEQ